MKRQIRRAVASVLSVPATFMLVHPSSASAATVLAVEGTAQIKGNAQTAFNSGFCAQNTCRSIDNARTPFDVKPGSRQLQASVDATQGDIVLMGYSLGAATIYDRLREWAKTPALAPDSDRVVLVITYGNPENKFGGDDRKNSYAGLPAVQPYRHLDVTMQYDSVADVPTRFGWYSQMNIAFGRHLAYFEDVDIDDPDNLVYKDEDGTTYMLIKAETLPMLAWMDPWITDERMAELDAKYRPLIEKDYDRPAYVPQGEGADWGNGNPPPTIDDDEDDVEPETAEADDAEKPARQPNKSDGDDVAVDMDMDMDEDDAASDLTPAEHTADDIEDTDDDANVGAATADNQDSGQDAESSPQE